MACAMPDVTRLLFMAEQACLCHFRVLVKYQLHNVNREIKMIFHS